MSRDVQYIAPSDTDFPQPVLMLMGLTGMRPWRVMTDPYNDPDELDPKLRHFFFPCDDSDVRQAFADASKFVVRLFGDDDAPDVVTWGGAYQIEEGIEDEAILKGVKPPCREIRLTVYGSPTISHDIDWRPEEYIPEDYYAG